MSRLFEKFKKDILGLVMAATGLFLALSLISFHPTDPSLNSTSHAMRVMNYCGYVGSFLADALFQLFGLAAWLLVVGVFRLAFLSFQGQGLSLKSLRVVWASLLVLTVSSLAAIYFPNSKIYEQQIFVGGLLGLGISQTLIRIFNPIGVQIVLWTSTLVLVIFYSEKTIRELGAIPRGWIQSLKKRPWSEWLAYFEKPTKPEKAKAVSPEPSLRSMERTFFPLEAEASARQLEIVKDEEPLVTEPSKEKSSARRRVVLKTTVPQRVENWDLPKLSLLEDPPISRIRIDEREIKRKAELLKEKLAHFDVRGEVVAARPGPAVTMFEFKPDADVKLSKITELADDLSLALSSESLRILAPIPGRDVVGIETSNAQREVVYLKDMLVDEQFWKDDIKLPIALGKSASGDPKIVDLRKMPHLMVAGTTGSGKSVFIVSTIIGLLFKHSPKTLRLLLVDPKQVDLAAFEKVPHLIMPTVTDTKQAVSALRWAVREMEKRYKSMSTFGARGLETFNEIVSKLNKNEIEEHEKANADLESTPGKKGEQYYYAPQPYIVVVIEEFGDLMTVDKANVENCVVRLAQKARACGIHLVLAMQSPRKEVVTGLIKTNIPGRISFKVSSSMDSRIILDDVGAERLLAQGDMLFKSPGGSNIIRHHGPFLKDNEVGEVANFWSEQAEPQYDPVALRAIENSSGDGVDGNGDATFGADEYDERYDEILSWVSMQKEVSASLIQRRFQLGYPRAARIIETFEREGVVGPASGSKPRQVLVNNLSELG